MGIKNNNKIQFILSLLRFCNIDEDIKSYRMKLLLKCYLLVFAMGIGPMALNAQFSFGVFSGVANYQGDIAKKITDVGETHVAIGGGLGYKVSPYVDVKAQLILTKISGDDANYTDRANRGFKFESDILEFAGIIDYSVFGSGTKSNTGVFTPKFSPIVYVGLGVTKVTSFAECLSDSCLNNVGVSPFPEKDNIKSALFTVPFGVGFKYDASPLLSFGVRGGYRYSFSDYLDGISKAANADANDWYFILGANVVFYIQPKERGGF